MDTQMLERWTRCLESGEPVLDLRARADYERGHLTGATNIPFAELRERRHEMPDRGARLTLVYDLDSSDAQALLADWDYEVVDALPLDAEALDELQQHLTLETGNHSRLLWRPSSLLSRHIVDIEAKVKGRCVLDLACGSGRDSLYLAQRGWQVMAVDIQHDALSRLQLSAQRHRVSIDTLCQNIERDLPQFAPQSFDLIVVVRYLHRPLLPVIGDWLKSGGYLLYQQFHSDAAAYGKPRSVAHLLRTGELAQAFNTWQIEVDDIERLDDGRPMVNFLARKP